MSGVSIPVLARAEDDSSSFFDRFSVDYYVDSTVRHVEQKYIRPSMCYLKKTWPTVENIGNKVAAFAIGIILALSLYMPRLGMALFVGTTAAYLYAHYKNLKKRISSVKDLTDQITRDIPTTPPTWNEVLRKVRGICQVDGAFARYLNETQISPERRNDKVLQAFTDCRLGMVPTLNPIIVDGKVYDAERVAYYHILHGGFPWGAPLKKPPEIDPQAYSAVRAWLVMVTVQKQLVENIRELDQDARLFF